MNLTLRQLRALAAVAELGSFTEAARRLHLTQAAMSVLVRELETELGVRVLDRTTRQVRLSEAGREFLPSVLRVLNELNAGVASVSSLRDKKKGLVRVAAPQLMSCTLMPRVIEAFRKLYPDVIVQLFDTAPEQTLDRLMIGDVELAIGLDAETGPELSRRALFRDSHVLICRSDHPLAAKRKVRWRDLAAYPFIAPNRDFVKELAAELQTAAVNVTITPIHEVSYMATAIGMAAAGLGVTTGPSYASRLVKGYNLQTRPLLEPILYKGVSVYTIASKSLSPAATSFYDVLVKVAAEDIKSR